MILSINVSFFYCNFSEVYRVETIRIKQKHDNHFNEWLCGRRHDDLAVAYNFKAFKNMLSTERLFPDFVTLCKFNFSLYLFPHFLTNLIDKDVYSVSYAILRKNLRWNGQKKEEIVLMNWNFKTRVSFNRCKNNVEYIVKR